MFLGLFIGVEGHVDIDQGHLCPVCLQMDNNKTFISTLPSFRNLKSIFFLLGFPFISISQIFVFIFILGLLSLDAAKRRFHLDF